MKNLWANIKIVSLRSAAFLNRNTGFMILLSIIIISCGLFLAINGIRSQQTPIVLTHDNVIKLLEENNKLQQQNKTLAQENNRLADRQIFYIKCVAELFARHTRDDQPIEIVDITKCTTQSSQPTSSSKNGNVSALPPNNTQTPDQNQSKEPQEPNENPDEGGLTGMINRTVDRIMEWFQ